MKIKELTRFLEEVAPLSLQEEYDNSGLIVGHPDTEVKGVLVSLDITEAVIEEALTKGCNLIVAHHPILFRGIKRLNGSNYVERTLISAIKKDIALYAIHTNLDNVKGGVNYKIGERLMLKKMQILQPKVGNLLHLTVFVPQGSSSADVLRALHKAGAGQVGKYSNCSFQAGGTGTFRPDADAQPAIGQVGALEQVEENRIEVLLPKHKKHAVLQAMKSAHPYEEVAYYLEELANENQETGSGVVGILPEEMTQEQFLAYLKKQMNLGMIRYTSVHKTIRKVAVCGGSGSFLLKTAMSQGADAFVTADYKYHEFFDAEEKVLIADIGHFESEVFTKDLLVEIISKKITNFATYLSEVNTNPVNYYY
jgi:dinuclear metal center YbgI/SA1388 family protein